MRTYGAFFKMRFIHGLQYRSAAYAGVLTQFMWGFMYVMIYEALYASNPNQAPMAFSQLTTYVWLNQAFLSLFMLWFLDNELFESITSGNVAYELCRPLNLYSMWFAKNCASRLSRVVLRCMPILAVAFILPAPYRFMPPTSFPVFLLFLFSMLLSLIVVVAYCMLIYIITFYTISSVGVKIIFVMIGDFFAGGIIPLPFLPDRFQGILSVLPFASMQNMPYRIYNGHIQGRALLAGIGLQILWAIVLIVIGYYGMQRATQRVIVQGG